MPPKNLIMEEVIQIGKKVDLANIQTGNRKNLCLDTCVWFDSCVFCFVFIPWQIYLSLAGNVVLLPDIFSQKIVVTEQIHKHIHFTVNGFDSQFWTVNLMFTFLHSYCKSAVTYCLYNNAILVFTYLIHFCRSCHRNFSWNDLQNLI